jgi:hypothetical protein
MNKLVDQITERVLSKITEDAQINSDGWKDEKRKAYDPKTYNGKNKTNRDLGNIHRQNANIATAVKRKQQSKNPQKPTDNFTTKPVKGITKEEKEKLVKQISEIKSAINQITKSVPQSVLQEVKYKKFMRKLNEYMNIDDFSETDFSKGDYGNGDYAERIVDESGDEMLDQEMSTMGGSPTSDTINAIMKQTLSAMTTLADRSQSPEFQTMNNIFNQCQKYNTAKKDAGGDNDVK